MMTREQRTTASGTELAIRRAGGEEWQVKRPVTDENGQPTGEMTDVCKVRGLLYTGSRGMDGRSNVTMTVDIPGMTTGKQTSTHIIAACREDTDVRTGDILVGQRSGKRMTVIEAYIAFSCVLNTVVTEEA